MEKQLTIRELIKQIRDEIFKSEDLLPDRAAELLAKLSALYGNCIDEVRKREMEYNKDRRMAYESEGKSNRAEILSKSSPSYEAWREAQDTAKLCLELVRGLKYFLKSKSEELRESKY